MVFMKLLVKNGTLVTGEGQQRADLLIENERIARVAPHLEDSGAEILDAAGCLVFPGFIDAHTHLDMECAAGFTADDFETGTRAALAGGTTTVVDFATQDKGQTLEQGLKAWEEKAQGKAMCDYGFHMAITDWTQDIPEQMADMCRRGITSFKIYLAYDNLRLTEEQVEQVLSAAAKLGAVVCAHCEDGDDVDAGIARQKELGHFGPEAHPASRPNEVEAKSVAHFLDLARRTGAQAYVVHLSTRQGLEVIRSARQEGQVVWVETCPQYLALTDEVYHRPGFEGGKFVCSPPIRSQQDQDALWQALEAGEIEVISTDHCSFTLAQKAIGQEDFSLIPNGLPGIEHRAQLVYGLGVASGKLTPSRMCALLSETPARIFGLYPRKGSLQVGADADLVIWDPAVSQTISVQNHHQNVDYTPYEGLTLPGQARQVLLRGKVVSDCGKVEESASGIYLPRGGIKRLSET